MSFIKHVQRAYPAHADTCRRLGILVACFAILLLVYQLALATWLFLAGVHSSNAPYFWVVARAWINGFRPYLDIYEPKPPGLFVLGALSYWIFQSPFLGVLLSVAILWIIPFLFVLVVRERGRLWMILGWIYGALLTLYMVQAAGAWEAEYLGGFFGVIYVVAAYRYPNLALPTAALFCAIGIKEPFFLVALGSAIILFPSRKAFFYRFVLPGLIVAVLGCVLLAISGLMAGYAGIYLPAMFEYRVFYNSPLWLRGFELIRVARQLAGVIPLLPAVLGVVAVCTIRNVSDAIRLAIGTVITITAVGIASDWQEHHFVFAVPFYAALLLRVAEQWKADTSAARLATLLLLSLCSLTAISAPSTLNWSDVVQSINQSATMTLQSKDTAATLDSILTSCGIKQYLFLSEPTSMFAYTNHTPLNYFPYTQIEQVLRYDPEIKKRTVENLARAEVIVIHGPSYVPRSTVPLELQFGELVRQYIEDNFSLKAPECARAFLPMKDHVVLFRIARQIN